VPELLHRRDLPPRYGAGVSGRHGEPVPEGARRAALRDPVDGEPSRPRDLHGVSCGRRSDGDREPLPAGRRARPGHRASLQRRGDRIWLQQGLKPHGPVRPPPQRLLQVHGDRRAQQRGRLHALPRRPDRDRAPPAADPAPGCPAAEHASRPAGTRAGLPPEGRQPGHGQGRAGWDLLISERQHRSLLVLHQPRRLRRRQRRARRQPGYRQGRGHPHRRTSARPAGDRHRARAATRGRQQHVVQHLSHVRRERLPFRRALEQGPGHQVDRPWPDSRVAGRRCARQRGLRQRQRAGRALGSGPGRDLPRPGRLGRGG
jgi:hypothetical protein